MRNLFPSRAIFSTLGALMQDPMLLDDGKIRLDREDFTAEGEPIFHVMIFATIHNLFAKGLTKITPIEIDEYLSEYTKNYEIFKENDGLNWCFEAIKFSKVENYEAYAEKVKKYSLLRRLINEGISLEGIYDVTDEDDERNGEAQAYFDSLSLDDVLSIIDNKVGQITTDYQVGYDRESSKAGDNGLELLQRFKEAPMYGLPTNGEMQNTIFRGILMKNSLIRSALTNIGKTRISIGEAADIAISKWYNHKTKTWEKKGNKHKVLFISTEMSEDELQPTMWAYVSGIAEEKIVDGALTEEEEKIVIEAIEHLQECDLFIEYVPKFDPQTINAIIKEYATRENIEVVYFDYIHLSFDIMISIANETRGMSMREDMMLNIFASGLEELARQYNFHLRTSTQMNGDSSQRDQTSQMLDQSLLRGAKSMADKFQYGIIMTKPTEKELELLEPITSQGFGNLPNMVYHIYKNRRSKWKGKLYLYIDYDTMRVEELFFTDFSGKEIKVPRTVLEENDVDVVEEPF